MGIELTEKGKQFIEENKEEYKLFRDYLINNILNQKQKAFNFKDLSITEWYETVNLKGEKPIYINEKFVKSFVKLFSSDDKCLCGQKGCKEHSFKDLF